MDNNYTDIMLMAMEEIQNIKWLIDEGPAHVKLTEAQTQLTKLKTTLSAIDPEAIRREVLAKAEELFKNRAHTIAYEMAGASGGNIMSITAMQEALMMHVSDILSAEPIQNSIQSKEASMDGIISLKQDKEKALQLILRGVSFLQLMQLHLSDADSFDAVDTDWRHAFQAFNEAIEILSIVPSCNICIHNGCQNLYPSGCTGCGIDEFKNFKHRVE